MLVDTYGRVATDLRVSLTDRCNLRCTYCMPPEGLDWLPRPELLTDDEVVAAGRGRGRRLGVTEVRFTGGEPLLRRGLVVDRRRVGALSPATPDLADHQRHRAGQGWRRRSPRAGLDRVNVSLDTLDPERFGTLTRRDRLADVLAGLAAAADAGLTPVKVNAVLMRGVNDDEAAPLLRWSRSSTATSCGSSSRCRWTPSTAGTATTMVTAEEILAACWPSSTLTAGARASGAARRPRPGWSTAAPAGSA